MLLRSIFWMGSLGCSLLFCLHALALPPTQPEDVLSDEQIADIIARKDYFYIDEMDLNLPIWRKTKRQYAKRALSGRTHLLTMSDVIHRVLTDGLPIQYQMEQMIRGRLGIHNAIGDLIPSIDLKLGYTNVFGASNMFSSLFGFLLPANWLKLIAQKHAYTATQLLLLKTVLDQIVAIKEAYYVAHNAISDLEILNYYLAHLHLLSRLYPHDDRTLQTLIGQVGVQASNTALQIGQTGFALWSIGQAMALEKLDGFISTKTLNIADISDFPNDVPDLPDLEFPFQDFETFINETVRLSVEMKIADEYYKISKLNVGISATSNTFYFAPGQTYNRDLQLGVRLGYNSIPNVLTAKSFQRTAQIDVESEFIALLGNARRSLGFYKMNVVTFSESHHSLSVNRAAFKKNVRYYVDNQIVPDATFLFSLTQLITTELQVNAALHGSLISRAYMDRYTLRDQEIAAKYLPAKGAVMEFFARYLENNATQQGRESLIESLLKDVRKEKRLQLILYEHKTIPGLQDLSHQNLVSSVQDNIANLLHTSFTFRKNEKFFRMLQDFITTNNIVLTRMEEQILEKKSGACRNKKTVVANATTDKP